MPGETTCRTSSSATRFYEPTEHGDEKVIAERVRWIRAQQSPPLSREGEGAGVRESSPGVRESSADDPKDQSSSADKAD